MKKQEIADQLFASHKSFTEYLGSLTNAELVFSQNDKWTAGQTLDHMLLSVKPLVQALRLPKFILRLFFGKANRPSRTYEEVVEKYQGKLQEGGRASGRFVPPAISPAQKDKLISKLKKKVGQLTAQVARFSEEELDQLILPHPLLGKLTLREMLYFTIYHVKHHEKTIQRNLVAPTGA
jgi:hypothetical protein